MKTRILAAAAAASLLLTGCAGLLDRDYVSITVHSTTPATEGDNSALRAESYQELVNILTYLVSQNMPSASIRLYESEDVQADLERACVEVAQEYPLGAYAVDYIQYHVSPILSYHEAEVQITYRRTKEQMDAIVSATGITAIRSQLESALEQFSPECTLSISYFDGGVEDIQALFRQAYFAVPDAAEDLPDVSVSLYPDSGRQRIVELELNYHLSQEELLRRQETTRYQCQELARDLKSYTGDLRISAAGQTVLRVCSYTSDGGSTPYLALTDGRANSQGLALFMAALCQQLDVDCMVVEGSQNGRPHFWNVVSTQNGWRHLDLAMVENWISPYQTDAQMTAAGYVWDGQSVPQCPAPFPAS